MFRIHHALAALCITSATCVSSLIAGDMVATTQALGSDTEAKKLDGTILRYLDTLSLRKDPKLGKADKTIVVFGSAQLSTDAPAVSGSLTTQPATQPALDEDGSTVELTRDVPHGNDVIVRAHNKSGSEIGPITIKGKQLQINGMSVTSDKNGDVVIVEGRNTLTAKQVKLGEANLTAGQNGEVLILDDLKQLSLTYTPKDQNSTYLGVGVEPPGDALRSQLNLAPGGGLLVNYIDETGPCKSVLQKHDVLQKLDDQILVNAEQLVALIHMHSPGDSVVLTFLRQASPRTERITLGHKAPELHAQGDVKYTSLSIPVLADLPRWGTLFRADGSAVDATFSDGEMSAVLDSSQNLTVADVKSGSTVFQGPVSTHEQWEKVPTTVRKKLADWRDMVGPKKDVVAPPTPK